MLADFSVVYGTAVGFTKRFAEDSSKYVAICGLIIGIGEVLCESPLPHTLSIIIYSTILLYIANRYID